MFDRCAETASRIASSGYFFSSCLLIVILWLPSYFIVGNLNTWQLIINTLTTIITFLLVALLQNSQKRSEDAMHAKLDAIAEGLADFMEHYDESQHDSDFVEDINALRKSIGVEQV